MRLGFVDSALPLSRKNDHDLDIVPDIADDCCVLQGGALTARGLPNDILRDEPLLARTRLIHAHLHVHDDGKVHKHHHLHRHYHDH